MRVSLRLAMLRVWDRVAGISTDICGGGHGTMLSPTNPVVTVDRGTLASSGRSEDDVPGPAAAASDVDGRKPSVFGAGITQIGSISNSSFMDVAGNAVITDNSKHNIMNISYVNIPPPPSPSLDLVQLIENVKARLEAFATIKFTKIHQEVAQQRTAGTGESFKAKKEIREWYAIKNSFLWVRGGPGAGKTYLSCALVEWAASLAASTKDTAVVCVYLRHNEQLTAWEIVLGIIIQLVHYSTWLPSVTTMVQEVFKRHRLMGSKPSLTDLEKLLNNVLREFRRASIFVDGLDEMKPEVQAQFTRIVAGCQANVLFMSRYLVLLEENVAEVRGVGVEELMFVDVTAEEGDLDLFIEDTIRCTPGFNKLLVRCGVRDEVVETVKVNAGGMFLHAYLHMQALRKCRALRSIREVLNNFPTGINALYDDTVKRIMRVSDDEASLMLRVLIWIVYSKRPLTILELRHAVAVSPETHQFDSDRDVMEEYIIAACCGLISVEKEKGEVRLIHFTAQSSLPAILSAYEPFPLDIITRTCLTRLTESGYQNSHFQSSDELQQSYNENPFLEYSHSFGHHHARDAILKNPDLYDYIRDFIYQCQSFPYPIPGDWFSDIIHLLNPIQVATLFDVPKLIVHLALKDGWDVNSVDGWGLTSLTISVLEGLPNSLKTLLQMPGINTNVKDRLGYTPFMAACGSGDVAAAKILLQVGGAVAPAAINHQDDMGRSALSLASKYGHDGVVEVLLADSQIDVNQPDFSGWTPLFCASLHGHDPVVKRLLSFAGTDVNQKTNAGNSPLGYVSGIGDDDVVKLLLDAPNINVNLQDKGGCTALIKAAGAGKDSTVRLLLGAKGVDVGKRDNDGCTALIHALVGRRYSTAKILLAAFGIKVDLRDEDEWTTWIHASLRGDNIILKELLCPSSALILASASGDEAMVRLFLKNPNVKLHQRGHDGRTALIAASSTWDQSDGIVKLLLASPGLNVNHHDIKGRTALFYATFKKHVKIVKMLLASPGIEVNHRDRKGRTALMHACSGRKEVIVRLLLAQELEVNLVDDEGRTALYHAVNGGDEVIVKLLLGVRGLDVNRSNVEGWTPLILAASCGDERVCKTFLGVPGIEVNRQSEDGRTAVWAAAYMGHVSTLNVLLSHREVRVDTTSKFGLTILGFVLSYHLKLYHRIEEHNEDLDPQPIILFLLSIPRIRQIAHLPDEKRGTTPLMLAARFGYGDVVEQLLLLPNVKEDVGTILGLN